MKINALLFELLLSSWNHLVKHGSKDVPNVLSRNRTPGRTKTKEEKMEKIAEPGGISSVIRGTPNWNRLYLFIYAE